VEVIVLPLEEDEEDKTCLKKNMISHDFLENLNGKEML